MSHDAPADGLWSLVVFNSAIFIMFAFSFFKPQTPRDWRTFEALAAVIVALFVEMYGFLGRDNHLGRSLNNDIHPRPTGQDECRFTGHPD